MIRLIEATNFKCLKQISQPLDNFHVLVGPNASGKTTFLEVVAFLGDLISDGLESAVSSRTANFQDLVWKRGGGSIRFGIEFQIPPEIQNKLSKEDFDIVRYEIEIGIDKKSEKLVIKDEMVFQLNSSNRKKNIKQIRKISKNLNVYFFPPHIIVRKEEWNAYFNEIDESEKSYKFKLGPSGSGLANLPEDESKFPVGTWLKGVLRDRVQMLVLNSALMRNASPPDQGKSFKPDGSNLPWIVEDIRKNHPEDFKEWIEHLRTALPDLKDIKTVLRPEDRHRYLMVHYKNNVKVPSWTVSDGTLKLFALTLLAYIPKLEGVFLIEEPENGVHPQAIETIFHSLTSVYDAQVLLATHSPVLLSLCEAKDVLCFNKTKQGATEIVSGDKHPALSDWKGIPNLSVLFASGVLG